MSERKNKASSTSSGAMTKVQLAYITKVTKKINDCQMARYFRQPVDPKLDGATDYFDRIKKPMDLGTVLQNLQDNKYTNVEKWREDMNLIWKNAMTYNGPESPLYAIAKDLSEMTRKMTELIPSTPTEEWMIRLRSANEKVIRIMEAKRDDPAPNVVLMGGSGYY